MVPHVHVGATSMMLAQKTQQLLQKMKDLKDIMDTLIAKRDEKVVQEYLFLSTHVLEELL